jgi:hypothetical protein
MRLTWAKAILLAGLSFIADGVLYVLVEREARIKDDAPSVSWWLATIIVAVVGMIPLAELARRGKIVERFVAILMAVPPLGWLAACAYAAWH